MSLGNTIDNSGLERLMARAPQSVVKAIQGASDKTGVDFSYLLQQAGAESSFKPEAKAKTSSASGLYQFIESTWLSMVDKYGDKHGIETEGQTKGQLLALRNNPETASAMAAEFASENERYLRSNYDGEIGSTELYFAHFMGAGGGAAFLNARADNPMNAAADIFPKAAKANKNVFFDTATGRAKSLDEVYAFFDKKFGVKGDANTPKPASESLFVQNDTATSTHKDLDVNLFTAQMPSPFITQKPTTPSYSAGGFNTLGAFTDLIFNPIQVMLMAQMEDTISIFDYKDSNGNKDRKS